MKSSKSLLLTNVSFISLRCRTFFSDEFSKKYEYTIDDICNKRLPERETKLFVQRIKTRIPVPITMTFVILLRAYFLMFRQIKILIFNSWTTTDDICYPITMLICFVTEFDDWTFKIDRQYVSQQQICYKRKCVSILSVRPPVISDTLSMFVQNDTGKQSFVDFFLLIRCL